MEANNSDLVSMSLAALTEKVDSSEENKNNVQLLNEIVTRKPVYNQYIERLVTVHDNANEQDKSRELLQGCLEANECNLDLWIFYLNWSLSNDYIANKDEEKTREVFEEARSKIGKHPQAWKFWEKYAQFDTMCLNNNSTNFIYYCALLAKIEDLDTLREVYLKFIDEKFDSLKDLISSENPPEFKDEKPTLMGHFLDASNDKDNFVKIIEDLFTKAKGEITERSSYERSFTTLSYAPSNASNDALKQEKETWKSYIDKEKTACNYQGVQMLYKRMLIPFYDDFSVWEEYIDYLANTMSQVDKCRTIYKKLRASPIVENKDAILKIYLSNASFEENQGQIKLARKIHQTICNSLCPSLIKGIVEYIKFEQRVQGPKKNILVTLEDSLERAIKKEDEFATIFLTVNTCRFHFANEQDLDLVFDIFSDSVKSFRNSKQLYLNLIKLLESIDSTENKLYSRSFEIIEKATLDAKSEFQEATKKEIAEAYYSWMKRKCNSNTYIEVVESRFMQSNLIQGEAGQVPAYTPEPNGVANPEAPQALPMAPAPPAMAPAPAPLLAPAPPIDVGHVGEKRPAEVPATLDGNHKRQKIEE